MSSKFRLIGRRALLSGIGVSAVVGSQASGQRINSAPQVSKGGDIDLLAQLQHVTVQLNTTDKNGVGGSGTSFNYVFFDEPRMPVPVLVTNVHVLKDAESLLIRLTRKGPDGLPDLNSIDDIQIPNVKAWWAKHPGGEDLAIIKLLPALGAAGRSFDDYFWKFINKSTLASEELVKDLEPLEEVLVVGYPVGVSDVTHNLPIFRKGITATSVGIDYQGKKDFLIDAAVWPGSSGSPVFLFNYGSHMEKRNNFVLATRIALLGIVDQVYHGPVEGVVASPVAKGVSPEKVQSWSPDNLGICLKASLLTDFEGLLTQ